MMTINLDDPQYYTDTFYKVQECFTADKRFNIIQGGSNSSKSYSVYQQFILAFLIEKEHDYLVLRKYGTSIYDSVFQGMKNIILDWNIGFMFKSLESPGKLTIINNSTGRRMIFRGLDDTEKIKSIVNIKFCLMEEANEFSQSDFLELNRRLRGFEGIKYFLVFNPISRNLWLRQYFYLTPRVKDKTTFVHCTYHDNRFATPEDIEELEGLKDIDINDYNVYCLGNWGVLSSRIIFPNWETITTIPEGAVRIPSGMDFGYSPDPTTLTDLYIMPGALVMHERINDTGLVSVKTDNPLSKSIQGELETINFSKNDMIIADSAGQMSIRELRDNGYNIFAVKKPGILESLKLMKSYRLLVTESSINIIKELENYIRKVDNNGTILPEPIDAFNHHIDPTRYVLWMKGRLW